MNNNMKKDLFISHASEDKNDFVRPLAGLLAEYGVDVWYDEFELRIGSSISRSIDKGIKNSHFGLIILSKYFFKKNWTEYELRSLNSFEIESGDVLLPVWKDVTVKEVRDFSPYLADKFALTTDLSLEDIALKLIEVVKPNLFSLIHQKIAAEKAVENGKVEMVKVSDIRPGPIRHTYLNDNLISRIRMIRSSLWLCYPHSMEYWVDGFQRDLNIETEIRYWEHIGTCFLETILQFDIEKHYLAEDKNVYENIFKLLLELFENRITQKTKGMFSEEFINIVTETFRHKLPTYDIKEDSPFSKDSF